MTTQQITRTTQLDFKFNNHCFGACGYAAIDIAKGDTVKFDVFKRNPLVSTELEYKSTWYFGLFDIDGKPALRVSNTPDLDASGTHSLIASWNDEANNPVFISARLVLFLMREGSDWFINSTPQ